MRASNPTSCWGARGTSRRSRRSPPPRCCASTCPSCEARTLELPDGRVEHQDRALAGIEAVELARPGLPAVACFDTAFHAGLPAAAAAYALPLAWRERFGLRRYGFHGLSHRWVARQVAECSAATRPRSSPQRHRGRVRMATGCIGERLRGMVAAPNTARRTTPPAAAIEAVSGRDIVKRFGSGETAVDALRGVSIGFARGTFTAIMGPSGSGKSTLLHILAGLDRPTSGTVEIAGTALGGLDDHALTLLRRRQIGFIFQSFNLLPVLTAEENIGLPLRIAGDRPDPEWLETLISTVRLTDRRAHRPSELSGGQQQRVAVARALIARPAAVFADEPTGNLDSASGHDVLALLRRAVDEFGQTIVMVTHDPTAAAIADRVVFLADGRIVDDRTGMDAASILDHLKSLG